MTRARILSSFSPSRGRAGSPPVALRPLIAAGPAKLPCSGLQSRPEGNPATVPLRGLPGCRDGLGSYGSRSHQNFLFPVAC